MATFLRCRKAKTKISGILAGAVIWSQKLRGCEQEVAFWYHFPTYGVSCLIANRSQSSIMTLFMILEHQVSLVQVLRKLKEEQELRTYCSLPPGGDQEVLASLSGSFRILLPLFTVLLRCGRWKHCSTKERPNMCPH